MKYTFMILILILISCNNKKSEPVTESPKVGSIPIAAVITLRDSSKIFEAVMRTIAKTAAVDSVTKQDIVIIDTFWDRKFVIPVQDEKNKPVLDSAGKQKYETRYLPVPKDSINWHIENINVDSLLFKR